MPSPNGSGIMNMEKLISSVACMVILCSSLIAQESQDKPKWDLIRFDDKRLYFMNTRKVEVSPGVIKAWEQIILRKKGDRVVADSSFYEDYDYEIILLEFDCKRDRIRPRILQKYTSGKLQESERFEDK